MYSFGYFPGVWLKWQYADVSEHSFSSIFKAFEDGTDRVFRNVGIQQSDAGEIPKRIHTFRFKTWRKFEIKNQYNSSRIYQISSLSTDRTIWRHFAFNYKNKHIPCISGCYFALRPLWRFIFLLLNFDPLLIRTLDLSDNSTQSRCLPSCLRWRWRNEYCW